MRSRLAARSVLLGLALALGAAAAQAGALAKLTIQPEKGDKVEVMFNPKEYTITKSTPWKHHDIQGLDAPTLEFTSGEPYRMQIEQGMPITRILLVSFLKNLVSQPGDPFPPLVELEWDKASWAVPLLAVESRRVENPKRFAMHSLWGEAVPIEPDPIGPSLPVIVRTDFSGVRAALKPVELNVYTLPRAVGFAEKMPVPQPEPGVFDLTSLPSGPEHRLVGELWFDTYDTREDVRDRTNEFRGWRSRTGEPAMLVQIELPGPRYVNGILESFSLRYTLFLEDGTPVRAVMNTVWKEFSPAEEQLKGNPRH